MQEHLRPVPSPNSGGHDRQSNGSHTRRRAIPRTSKPLPSDRMKFEAAKQALKAIAISSDFGQRTVGSGAIARALSVVETTAGLNNAFFVDSGLVIKQGRGQYKPTEATNAFARKHSFDAAAAGLMLAETLRKTWFFKAVEKRLHIGPATKLQVLDALAHEAGATAERKAQLEGLLDWLQYAGLIDAHGSHVTLRDASESVTAQQSDGPTETDGDPAGSSGEGTTNDTGHQPRKDAVLSMSFDFALSADDLKRLSPEQIKALFEAVGVLAATRGALT